jgi:hypothetical protein
MDPRDFIESPRTQASLHAAYEHSFLHMRPAPEYASGEVVLASTYRRAGLDPAIVTEGKVPSLGREFQKLLDKGKRPGGREAVTGIDADAWSRIVSGTLRSPKQPNQSSKRFLQISPIVPDAAMYSLSARLSANSWNPGELVAAVVQYGSKSRDNAQVLWQELFNALSVDENDDIWARFLDAEFRSWRPKPLADAWHSPRALTNETRFEAWHQASTRIPASQFVEDLGKILALKGLLTRRQWISMLEAMLRIGTASHILWVCKANIDCLELARKVLQGSMSPPDHESLKSLLSTGTGFWRYGQYASATLTANATGFVKARAGLNLMLHQLESEFGPKELEGALANTRSITAFLAWLGEIRERFNMEAFRGGYQEVIESDPRLVAGKKGIASNIQEFLRHVLGQRQTAERGLGNYDQGYFMAKSGSHQSARWAVGLGPVSVLALVHACTSKARGPRTVDDFCRHIGQYGIEVEAQDIAGSALGQTLRNLGLVLDSPDAEGGMVLVNPFEIVGDEGAQA